MGPIRVAEAEANRAFDDVVEWQELLDDGSRQVAAEVLIAQLRASGAEPLDDGGVEIVDECEQDLPFAPMWVRRNASGVLERVCGHSPEHVTVLQGQ